MQTDLPKSEGGPALPGRGLRLLSYNIQAGIDTRHYREYLTKGWKHLLPSRERMRNLNSIANMLRGYDLVGLQEVDSGSLRSGFLDMTEYLAHRGGYPHWYTQVNRNMGMVAQHSNGFLSKVKANRVTNYRLPPGNGRGAMLLEFGTGAERLGICSVHLALRRRVRIMQLDFMRELVADFRHIVVMGDLNTGAGSREIQRFVEGAGLAAPRCQKATFPSWRPVRRLDHILVSPTLRVRHMHVLDYPLSDHLPISVELHLPPFVGLAA
jgi:endonuclease/exonuclease/phosphatase family metal-dependent hydrolase